MSYEGYVQAICKNGHYSTFDCRADDQTCHVCHTPFERHERHAVDETNCEGEPKEVIITKPAKIFDLAAAIEALEGEIASNDKKNSPKIAQLKKEILDNAIPKMLEPPLHKFGKIIKYKRDW